ncbi:MAG TPA: hypothetical protein VF483_09955 [Gemmatimonadaceae bacterium]
MKKDDALNKLDAAGNTINSLYGSAWNTALNPTSYGWGKSLMSVVSIPVLSFASLGHLVGSSVVKQVPDDTFEKITTFGAGEPPKKSE